MTTFSGLAAFLIGVALFSTVVAGATTPNSKDSEGEVRFLQIYKELVETNTTLSAGNCTLAAERMAARLRAAGLPDQDLKVFTAPDHPKEGGLVAVLAGREPKAKPILLLAHLDTVEAKREDWTRDPFTLIEEHGNFYARGASDDKGEASIWVDTLVRLASEHQRPRRTLKLALTCGEETDGAFDGAEWLSKNHRDWIDAAFAINEGAYGELDAQGNRVLLQIEAGEKTDVDYRLEVTNHGGHSSRPVKDNAIYHLAAALTRISAYEFPAQFNDANRGYFAGVAKLQAAKGHADIARAMESLVKDPNDSQSIAFVAAEDPSWNGMLRTTCVATMLDAGHAANALPQRARANIDCRIFPGVDPKTILVKLEQIVSDPAVRVSVMSIPGPASIPPPLTPAIMGPLQKLVREYWPGLPVIPVLQPGATDGEFLNGAGIPTYGIDALFTGPDLGNIHGLNEYVRVQSLLQDRAFMYRLVKAYAEQP